MTANEFLAIDFETADEGPDSACELGLVRVRGNRIAKRKRFRFRPPRGELVFTYIHGLTWEDLCDELTFGQLWPKISPYFDGVSFVCAHNASFDWRVLEACCLRARRRPPLVRVVCSMNLARRVFGIYPTQLPHVCQKLKIGLRHHDALSDAEACARIVIAAQRAGADL